MRSKENIIIRKIPKSVLQRLDEKSEQAGFRSRQEYLLEILTQLSLEELQLETENRYRNLLEELKEVLKINTEIIQNNTEMLAEMLEEMD